MTGQEIRDKRTRLKLTQIEVANKVGVSLNAYCVWEKGGARPTPENLEKLKVVFEEAATTLMTYLKEA